MLLKDLARVPEPEDTLPQDLADDYTSLIGLIHSRYNRAKYVKKQRQEQIWLNAFNAWRGELSPEERTAIASARARNGAASGHFIKVTKTKVTAAFGQICEILFANNKFPIAVEPTPVPSGVESVVTITPEGSEYQGAQDIYGYEGDGKEIPKGATRTSLLKQLQSSLSSLVKGQNVVAGASPDPKTMPEVRPAEAAAIKLEKVMHDQLEEGSAEAILRKATFEAVLYGTGIVKGPFSVNEIQPVWEVDEENNVNYRPENRLVPRFSHVSCWNFYPDPDAERVQDCEWVIERHLLSKGQLKKLASRPKFNKEAISELLVTSANHPVEPWETLIGANPTGFGNNRFEVLEYWGLIDKELVVGLPGFEFDDEDLSTYQINAWVCNGYVLRVVINPFLPNYIPYHAVAWEEHPHKIWGIGVAENMADTQALMNGHLRMAIDNLRLAGHCVFEVNETYLAPGQNFDIFPGKVFRMQGGAPGQAIHSISFNNTAPTHMQFFDKARQLADESTGIPSYAHGNTQGNASMTRTASAMSMLMSAAALNTKTVAKNFDEFIMSVGQALFRWNMQFNVKDKGIRGDVKIVAKGTASLMQREVVTQRLLSLLQIGSNPAVAPFLKVDAIAKEIVRNMDLDGEKYVNDPTTALLFAQSMGQTMPSTVINQQQSAEPGQPPQQPDASGGMGGAIDGGRLPTPQPPMGA